ncbi:TetR/AcrR family transcriptional regulator [Brevibacterium album]|uniref:TetR/AcrR family transcriptional regulator n=1 Tax=Brevibacterium album TaxID=417948 RepID=UPI00041B7DE9|nr:TetR/AcrR family transcriptional regulator [Brevibacterium album]
MILRAAGELFAEKGFTAATVRGIAARAGVSAGRVMAVGDKERLLVLTVEAEVQRIHEEAESRALGRGGTASTEVCALVRPFVELFTSDPPLAREYGAVLMRGRTRAAIFEGLSARLEAEIEEVLRRRAAGPSDAERVRRGARTVYLAYLGALFAAAHGALPFAGIEGEVAAAVRAVQGEPGDSPEAGHPAEAFAAPAEPEHAGGGER